MHEYDTWAARYNTWLKLTPKGIVFSFLFMSVTDLEVLAQVGVLHILPSEAHRAAPPEDSMQLILLKQGQCHLRDQWMIALAVGMCLDAFATRAVRQSIQQVCGMHVEHLQLFEVF